MKIYKVLYKCRYCGDVYYGSVFNDKDSIMTMRNLIKQNFYDPEGATFPACRYRTHFCANGAFGFSDFIGFEPYDVDEQKLS